MTRIVAGSVGGRRLRVPSGDVRPTSELVREGLFNTLRSLVDLEGARFADLYAGSGAVGLEAYSRGAAHVLLVESDRRVARTTRENIVALGAADRVRLVVGDVVTVLAAGVDEPYDVVFADPPYALPEERLEALQRLLLDGGWLAEGAVLVVERSRRSPEPWWVEPLTCVRSRRYGETVLWYGRRS